MSDLPGKIVGVVPGEFPGKIVAQVGSAGASPSPHPDSAAEPEQPVSAAGLSASFSRGAAPYAVGAGIGAAAGAPFAGVGAASGALAGVGAVALTQLVTGISRLLGANNLTPQDLTDKVFDAIGIRKPANWQERAAESVGGFLGGMTAFPTSPSVRTSGKALPVPQQLLQDFERQGVTPNVPTIGQGRSAGLASQIGNVLPIMGPVIRGGVTETLGETSNAVIRAAEGYGQLADTHAMGSVMANALKRFAADRSQATLDYGRFHQLMEGAPPAPASRTLELLNELMGKFPNAPELKTWQVRQPIVDLAKSLEPRTEVIPAKTSGILNEFGRPAEVQPAAMVQRGGVLSMPEFEELRSKVGHQLEHPRFGPDDIPRGELKRLYAALTKDMEMAALARGPEALQALERATINYGVRMKIIDRLEPLVTGEAKERTFARLNAAAMEGGRGDAGLLQAAKNVMSKEEWGDFGATIISRLGEPTAGAKDVLGETNFSVSSFTTNWNKLSDRAKDMVFGAHQPGSPREGLEELNRIAQAQKNVGKLANVSRSGEFVMGGALALKAAETAWHAVTTGSMREMVGWGMATGAGYGFAKMLMSPAFTRWLYSVPRTQVITPQMVSLSAINLLNALMEPAVQKNVPHIAVPSLSSFGQLPNVLAAPNGAMMGPLP